MNINLKKLDITINKLMPAFEYLYLTPPIDNGYVKLTKLANKPTTKTSERKIISILERFLVITSPDFFVIISH